MTTPKSLPEDLVSSIVRMTNKTLAYIGRHFMMANY